MPYIKTILERNGMKLISFDNSPYSAMSFLSITSIDRHPHLLAEKAAAILTDMISGRSVSRENVIPVSLVKRGSTRG